MSIKSSSGLIQKMIAPLTIEQFLTHYWPDKKLFASHGPLSRFKELTNFPADISKLSKLASKGKIGVWFPKRLRNKQTIKFHGMTYPAESASKFYNIGATISFYSIQKFIPVVNRLLRQFEQELGLLPGDGYCYLFVAPGEGEIPPHFDREANINIEILGKKTWNVTENEYVRLPVDSFIPSAVHNNSFQLEVKKYQRKPIPMRGPKIYSESFEADSGSFLFLPRGWWHQTKSLEPTISLAMSFGPRTWLDLVIRALSENLIKKEDFREFVTSRPKYKIQRNLTAQHVSKILKSLSKIVKTINSKELLSLYTKGIYVE